MLIQIRTTNIIDQSGLIFRAICGIDEVAVTATSPININNGSFSSSGETVFVDPALPTQGTYTISGTFAPAASAFSGTLRVNITVGTFGPCNTGPISWTASSVP
jgi:hypothetical protein